MSKKHAKKRTVKPARRPAMSRRPAPVRRSSDDDRRVVVTGLGVVSSIGIGIDAFWKNALAGRSGIAVVKGFENLDIAMDVYRSQVAGQVTDFDPAQLPIAHPERLDRYAQLSLMATKEALDDSGLAMPLTDPRRVGVMMGAGMGGMVIAEEEFVKVYKHLRPHRVHPNLVPMLTLNSASGILAITFGAKGINQTISTACSSSAHSIGQGLMAIRAGQVDVIIAGGAESSITPLSLAGFCALRALSTSFNDDPTRASRPFDRARDGFVMGEGAATLVLESLSHAKKRKAEIYAEVAGYGATSEAYHMVVPKEDGSEIAVTMELALRDAGIAPAAVDHINAHATSTPIGDPVEVTAIRRVFGNRADRILVNATKSMVGHTLGAAGALGAITCIQALRTGLVHPTANLEEPDPTCALGGISRDVQEGRVRVAVLNAFGFGSNNAVVVFKASPDGPPPRRR